MKAANENGHADVPKIILVFLSSLKKIKCFELIKCFRWDEGNPFWLRHDASRPIELQASETKRSFWLVQKTILY